MPEDAGLLVLCVSAPRLLAHICISGHFVGRFSYQYTTALARFLGCQGLQHTFEECHSLTCVRLLLWQCLPVSPPTVCDMSFFSFMIGLCTADRGPGQQSTSSLDGEEEAWLQQPFAAGPLPMPVASTSGRSEPDEYQSSDRTGTCVLFTASLVAPLCHKLASLSLSSNRNDQGLPCHKCKPLLISLHHPLFL